MNTIAKKLITLGFLYVLHVAPSMAFDVKADGIYLVPTKIGEKVFNDIVVLQEADDGTLTGSVTVPGNFTAKINEGKIAESLDSSGLTKEFIDFKITAIEGSSEINVRYYGQAFEDLATHSLKFSGNAFDLATGEAFGSFTAVLLRPVTQ